MLFGKILHDVNNHLRTFFEQTRDCLRVDSRGTFECRTLNTMTELDFKCCTTFTV